MFDWDSDLEEITANNCVVHMVPPAEKTGKLRAYLWRWMAPTAVAFGLIAAGQSVFNVSLIPSSNVVTLSSAGGMRAALFQRTEESLPPELIVYQEQQYASFMRGIVQFSDSAVLEYAATTARELRSGDDLMTPYQLDAMWLTNREIERRGLTPQTLLASYDRDREIYRQAQTDL